MKRANLNLKKGGISTFFRETMGGREIKSEEHWENKRKLHTCRGTT
jgi:hypothetical protein